MHKHRAFRALVGLGLAAGAGMVLCRMAAHHHRFADQPEDAPAAPDTGERRHGFRHGPWRKGYPPMFEEWHRRAHAQESAEAKPTAEAKPAAAEDKPAAEPAQA